ncbi:hypothetical protein APHAL10511_003287 [Amanita phalloides]|nr:hypothetical protein APHAL10511_003287 [Amanita phalloides]
MASEDQHLIVGHSNLLYGSTDDSAPPAADEAGPPGPARDGESFDNVPQGRRQLGVPSAVFLIFNRVIGSGIYATPSIILRASGSVGVTFIMWLLGAAIAAAGTAVYVELGSGLPRSGGEKNYLEFIYRRPKFFITCTYAVYLFLMGTAAANSIVFSQYLMHSVGIFPSRYNTQLIAFFCLTSLVLIHGTTLKWGVRLQNFLGVFKLFILSAIALVGIFSLLGVPGFQVGDQYDPPHNYEWRHFWEGSGTGVNAFVTGIYNVIWSFIGYSTANYALSEVKNPVRTIKRAAPIAMFLITISYLLINVAYFAVVSKRDILASRQIVAALFFRNLFGPATERILSAFIALSVLGNLLAGQFAQGRVVQELGREGILPWSSFLTSNSPYGAPLNALSSQYLVSCIFLFLAPARDIFQFLISLSSYCTSIVNTFVSLGLILLYTRAYQSYNWSPPFRAPKLVVIVYFLSNLFLIAVPFIPPSSGAQPYQNLPYWSHPVAGFCVSIIGIAYWYYFTIWEPRRTGSTLERVRVVQDDVLLTVVAAMDDLESNNPMQSGSCMLAD